MPTGKQIEQQISVDTATGIYANRIPVSRSVITCIFQRLPCRLQEESVLRIHLCCFAGGITKKGSIKKVYALQLCTGSDKQRIIPLRGRNIVQFVIIK